MKRILTAKMMGLAVAMVCLVALAAMATSATGAYFSDSKSGVANGTIGSIKVTTTGGEGTDKLNFNWPSMLPGQRYSMTATYQNTGDSVQDVWIVFDNRTALSRFNSHGAFGAALLTSSGGAYFYSNNLNDHYVDQGIMGPASVPLGQRGIALALPSKIKLASNVGPTVAGTMEFTFAYASGKTTTEYLGVFNAWPRVKVGSPAGAGWPNDGDQEGFEQNRVYEEDHSGVGLPFKIVATQPGVEPGTVGTYAGL